MIDLIADLADNNFASQNNPIPLTHGDQAIPVRLALHDNGALLAAMPSGYDYCTATLRTTENLSIPVGFVQDFTADGAVWNGTLTIREAVIQYLFAEAGENTAQITALLDVEVTNTARDTSRTLIYQQSVRLHRNLHDVDFEVPSFVRAETFGGANGPQNGTAVGLTTLALQNWQSSASGTDDLTVAAGALVVPAGNNRTIEYRFPPVKKLFMKMSGVTFSALGSGVFFLQAKRSSSYDDGTQAGFVALSATGLAVHTTAAQTEFTLALATSYDIWFDLDANFDTRSGAGVVEMFIGLSGTNKGSVANSKGTDWSGLIAISVQDDIVGDPSYVANGLISGIELTRQVGMAYTLDGVTFSSDAIA